jgi:heme/copper-type cytochrome/quinol oxidase subunit 1
MRAPGVALHKMPLFSWAVLVTAILLLLSLPVLAGGYKSLSKGFLLITLISERSWDPRQVVGKSEGSIGAVPVA